MLRLVLYTVVDNTYITNTKAKCIGGELTRSTNNINIYCLRVKTPKPVDIDTLTLASRKTIL